MSSVVLDASALLAHLNDEPGAAVVSEAIQNGALMSAVNLSEVIAELSDAGMTESAIHNLLDYIRLIVIDFGVGSAFQAGVLRRATRPHGLSLGDRACLALAWERKLPILTTDRAWSKLDAGIEIRVSC